MLGQYAPEHTLSQKIAKSTDDEPNYKIEQKSAFQTHIPTLHLTSADIHELVNQGISNQINA